MDRTPWPFADEEARQLPALIEALKAGTDEFLRTACRLDRRTQWTWKRLLEALIENEDVWRSPLPPTGSASRSSTSDGSSGRATSTRSGTDGPGPSTPSLSPSFAVSEVMGLAALKSTDREIERLFPDLGRVSDPVRYRRLKCRAAESLGRVAEAASRVVAADKAARVAAAGRLRVGDAHRLVELEAQRALACRELAEELELLDAVGADVDRVARTECRWCRRRGFVDDAGKLTGECCEGATT